MALYIAMAGFNIYRLMHPLSGIDLGEYGECERVVDDDHNNNDALFNSNSKRMDLDHLHAQRRFI